MKVLVLLLIVGVAFAAETQKKRGKGAGFDSVKKAFDCFNQFDSINGGNCIGGFLASCQDCDLDQCAQKCFFEQSNCKSFSYSNQSTPACVMKEIEECEKPEESDYTFYHRVVGCNLLPSGGLYPTSDGCAFAETSHRCDDMINECPADGCHNEDGCKSFCINDHRCHGVIFDTTRDTCDIWVGRNCSTTKNKYDLQYFEKYCGSNLEEFEKKRLEAYKRQCKPKCPSIPLPRGSLSDGASTEIGEVVTFFCLRGSLVGPRMLECVPDGEFAAKWTPFKPDREYGPNAVPRCDRNVRGSHVPPIIRKKD